MNKISNPGFFTLNIVSLCLDHDEFNVLQDECI